MKSKPPQPLTRRIFRTAPSTSSVFSARCWSPGPSFCSRYVCSAHLAFQAHITQMGTLVLP